MALDTHVEILNDYGLIGGYIAPWRVWAHGSMAGKAENSYFVPGRFTWRPFPGTPLRFEHQDDDDYGYVKSIVNDGRGLYCKVVVHDQGLLLDCALGQVCFSLSLDPVVKTKVRGGWRVSGGHVAEISLTPWPAVPRLKSSLELAELGQEALRRAALVAESESALTLAARPCGPAFLKDLSGQVVILSGQRIGGTWRYNVALPDGQVVQAGPGRNVAGGTQFFIPEVDR